MRAALVLSWVFVVATCAQAAPATSFPYTVAVDAEETLVRSGPGSRYYPTGRLKRGETVTVHRHDPGGWYMIAPPPGSFSWIPAKYVQKTGTDQGQITTDHVAVRVGSTESDIRELFQRKLASGDEVRILGEKLLPSETAGADELWYRIAPPRGEWRWVPGQALAPGSPVATKPPPVEAKAREPALPSATDFAPPTADSDYLRNDPLPPQSRADDRSSGLVERPLVRREAKGPAVDAARSRAQRNLNAQLEELDRLDARLRSILDRPPLEWDFAQLDSDYRALRDEAESDNLYQMVTSRLLKLESFRTTRAEHERLARVSAETLRRDAELAAVEHQQRARLTTMRQPRFDGAGIVERAALNRTGAPRYVLLNPAGRVLAYLVAAPGVNLDAWVGRAAGVNGSRIPHPDLKADLITVVRLAPVRLTP